jgi:hypothetical protein
MQYVGIAPTAAGLTINQRSSPTGAEITQFGANDILIVQFQPRLRRDPFRRFDPCMGMTIR